MARRHSFALLAGVLLSGLMVLVAATPAFAAAPRIILVAGGGLPWPVVLDDWEENLSIMLAATDAVDPKAEDLVHRSSFRLAMFWGSEWDEYLRAGKDPSKLRPDQAGQYGNYYPPTATHAAVFTFDSIPGPGAMIRRLTADGVSTFERHGIGSSAPPTKRVMSLTDNLAAHSDGLSLLGLVVAVVAGSWLALRHLRRGRLR